MAGIELVIPTTADAPSWCPILIHGLASYLICGRGLPAPWFEVEVANLTCSPVFDFHQPVIVKCGIAGDDADNRRGHLLPGIELLSTRHGPQLQEPCPKKVDVERFPVELGFESRLALLG